MLAGAARRDARCASVDAHGKHLFVRFEGELTLHSHLRMSGSWGVHREGARWKRAARRAWLVMRTDGWAVVQFDGPVLELMSEARTRSDRRLAALGQDVIGERFDHARFLGRLRADDPARPIGDALLDQQIVAGIGNVWKSESCFATGLDPWRPAGRVSDEEAIAVVEFAREHMRRSAEKDGFSTRPKAVYKRAGMPMRAVRHEDSLARAVGEQPQHLLVPRLPALSGAAERRLEHLARACARRCRARVRCAPGSPPAGRGCARRSRRGGRSR